LKLGKLHPENDLALRFSTGSGGETRNTVRQVKGEVGVIQPYRGNGSKQF
jgi:hypothetical protein